MILLILILLGFIGVLHTFAILVIKALIDAPPDESERREIIYHTWA